MGSTDTQTMSELATLVPSLKRQVAVPGDFDTSFPNTGDTDLLGSLGDAFGQAQLDGFFGDSVYDGDLFVVTPDLSPGGSAIIGLYAAENVLRTKLHNQATRTIYKAGTVEYQVDTSASAIVEEIRALVARRENLMKQSLRLLRAASPAVYVTDAYLTRSFSALPWFSGSDMIGFGFWASEYTGPW